MRKRITGLLLGICLVVSMLPATSFAAAFMADSYEEWCDFIERYPGDQFGYGFELSASQGFTWLEEEVTITIEKNLYVHGTWVIPENVTVLNHAQVDGNLSIEGVWKNEVKQITETNHVTGSVRGDVTVKDGGQFIAQNNGTNFSNMTVENGGTLTIDTYSLRIDPGNTLTLASGAIVNGNGGIQLGGTLCGEGVTLPQSGALSPAFSHREAGLLESYSSACIFSGCRPFSPAATSPPAGPPRTSEGSAWLCQISFFLCAFSLLLSSYNLSPSVLL